MTQQEVEDIISKIYGFVHFNEGLKLWQVVIDDVDVWMTQKQMEEFDEMKFNLFVAKRLSALLTEEKLASFIDLN